MFTVPAVLFSLMHSIRSVPLVGGSMADMREFFTAKPTP